MWPSLVIKFYVIDFERILTVLRNTYKLFLQISVSIGCLFKIIVKEVKKVNECE